MRKWNVAGAKDGLMPPNTTKPKQANAATEREKIIFPFGLTTALD